MRPLDAEIVSSRSPLHSDSPVEVKCRVSGSRPRPIVKWYLGERFLGTGHLSVSLQ